MTTTTLRVLPAPRHTPVGIPLPTHDQGRDEQLAQPTPYVQDALAVDFAAASDEQIFGPQPTRTCDLPDARQWAAHIAQGVVEACTACARRARSCDGPARRCTPSWLAAAPAPHADVTSAARHTAREWSRSTCASPPPTSSRHRSCSSTGRAFEPSRSAWPAATAGGSSRLSRSGDRPGQRPFLAFFACLAAARRSERDP